MSMWPDLTHTCRNLSCTFPIIFYFFYHPFLVFLCYGFASFFPQFSGGKNAGDGGQAQRRVGGPAGGEDQSSGSGEQAELSDPGAGGSAESSDR